MLTALIGLGLIGCASGTSAKTSTTTGAAANAARPTATPAGVTATPAPSTPAAATTTEANATTAPGSAPTGGQGVRLNVSLQLTGAVTGSVKFAQAAPGGATCAAYAKGSNGLFVLPEGGGTAKIKGTVVEINVVVDASYTGPGTYQSFSFGDPSTQAMIVDAGSANEPFQPAASTQSLTVKPDGSGSFTFTNWQDPGLRSVNGSETWTCTNPG